MADEANEKYFEDLERWTQEEADRGSELWKFSRTRKIDGEF